jgi:hypothetical protein
MNISSISMTNSTVTSNKYDAVVTALQKQKDELNNQIAEIKASKQDNKTKTEKINQITQQIADIDQQIMQAKLDAKQREIQEAQEKNAEKAAIKKYEQQTEDNGQAVVLSPSLNKLIAADKNVSDYQTMHTVRTKLKGEMAVSQGEIANSRGGSTQYQTDVISNNSSTLAGLENKMAKKVDEISKDIKSSVKSGIKEAEKDRANKDDLKENGTDTESTHSVPEENIKADIPTAPIDNSQESENVPKSQEDERRKDDSPKYRSVDVTV